MANKKRFLTFFLNTENVHLTKDVGMVPYILHKYYGYESALACYKNGDYPHLENEVNGLKIVFVKKVFDNPLLDGLYFILRNYRKYDILMCFHYAKNSLIWLNIFKWLKRKRGITYLKLDTGDGIMTTRIFKGKSGWMYKRIIKKIDIISVETKKIFAYLNKNWPRKVEYIPNGFYDYESREKLDFLRKENIILTVGRIGTHQKDTETLCKAFKKFAIKNKEWKLVIAGPIESDFLNYIKDEIEPFDFLKERIIFTGNIMDRNILRTYYAKAKIFTLTSRAESFGLVYLEAMENGCYIVSTDITPAFDITNNEEYGRLFPIGDFNKLAAIWEDVINADTLLETKCQLIKDFAYDNFYWPIILKKLDTLIQEKYIIH
ncbi:MAG: glycosyltransferase family 4 protein [Arachidicoccus sp.]|nr:glycosyltransferase family 4 protein [Arachidicoccus sp.]